MGAFNTSRTMVVKSHAAAAAKTVSEKGSFGRQKTYFWYLILPKEAPKRSTATGPFLGELATQRMILSNSGLVKL